MAFVTLALGGAFALGGFSFNLQRLNEDAQKNQAAVDALQKMEGKVLALEKRIACEDKEKVTGRVHQYIWGTQDCVEEPVPQSRDVTSP